MNLKNFSKLKGITLTHIATELKISKQAVSQWADGTTMPSVENYHKLLKILNVTPDLVPYERPLFFDTALIFGKVKITEPKVRKKILKLIEELT